MFLIQIIKKSAALLLLPAFTLSALGQNGAPYDMTVNGVKVIVQPSGNQIVQVLTLLKGGVQNYPAKKAGIESMAITALTECGTANDSKNSFKDKLDKVSAEIGGSAAQDYASLTLNCIRGDLDSVWQLYVDALTVPAFDTTEFARIRQDQINQLKSMASQPDEAIDKLARETAYAGKDFAKDPDGTEATVSPLTAAETKAYYQSILTRSRMLIVVVADLDRAAIGKMVTTLTANIPAGNPVVLKRYVYHPAKNSFTQEKREVATNYIEGITGGPEPGSADYNAFAISMNIFYNRHFLEIRTNNGLSYAPQAYFIPGLTPAAIIKVSTTDPNKYKMVLDQTIASAKKGFTETEVKDTKSHVLTSSYMKMESNSAQAISLAVNELLFNDWRRSINLAAEYARVTKPEVDAAFKKYINQITWVYQGDSSKVDQSLYKGTATKSPASKVKKDAKN